MIREALHNAIAHQDYTLAGRTILVEEPGSLLITNRGSFIPGTVEAVIRRDAPEDRYRNRFLADAMVNLNMIDTIGGGIKRQRLIEGRHPNLYVASSVAVATGARAAYIRNRGFDKDHYKRLVVSYLEKFGRGTRKGL